MGGSGILRKLALSLCPKPVLRRVRNRFQVRSEEDWEDVQSLGDEEEEENGKDNDDDDGKMDES